MTVDRRALNSHRTGRLNVKIESPFKGLTVGIFNLTWLKF